MGFLPVGWVIILDLGVILFDCYLTGESVVSSKLLIVSVCFI